MRNNFEMAMNEEHEYYDPDDTGHCQKITGVGHFIEAKPTRCWLTGQQHAQQSRAARSRQLT